jgi:hypothetical protein
MSGTRTGIVPQQGRTLLPEQIARNGRLIRNSAGRAKRCSKGKRQQCHVAVASPCSDRSLGALQGAVNRVSSIIRELTKSQGPEPNVLPLSEHLKRRLPPSALVLTIAFVCPESQAHP